MELIIVQLPWPLCLLAGFFRVLAGLGLLGHNGFTHNFINTAFIYIGILDIIGAVRWDGGRGVDE